LNVTLVSGSSDFSVVSITMEMTGDVDVRALFIFVEAVIKLKKGCNIFPNVGDVDWTVSEMSKMSKCHHNSHDIMTNVNVTKPRCKNLRLIGT
jgi:hypothetical protein